LAQNKAAVIESLQPRQLLSVTFRNTWMIVAGTPGDDIISVTPDARFMNLVAIRFNDEVRRLSTGLAASFPHHIDAGGGDDRILYDTTMNAGPNVQIYGRAGDDTIETHTSVSVIEGGEGNDIISASMDVWTARGGAGNDRVIGPVYRMYGDEGDDFLQSERIGEIHGGDGNDTLIGADRYETASRYDDYTNYTEGLYGGAGNDLIRGRAGKDELHGEDGKDTLYGGEQDDTMYAGRGDDMLYGGDVGVAFNPLRDGEDDAFGEDGKDWFDKNSTFRFSDMTEAERRYSGGGTYGTVYHNGSYGNSDGSYSMGRLVGKLVPVGRAGYAVRYVPPEVPSDFPYSPSVKLGEIETLLTPDHRLPVLGANQRANLRAEVISLQKGVSIRRSFQLPGDMVYVELVGGTSRAPGTEPDVLQGLAVKAGTVIITNGETLPGLEVEQYLTSAFDSRALQISSVGMLHIAGRGDTYLLESTDAWVDRMTPSKGRGVSVNNASVWFRTPNAQPAVYRLDGTLVPFQPAVWTSTTPIEQRILSAQSVPTTLTGESRPSDSRFRGQVSGPFAPAPASATYQTANLKVTAGATMVGGTISTFFGQNSQAHLTTGTVSTPVVRRLFNIRQYDDGIYSYGFIVGTRFGESPAQNVTIGSMTATSENRLETPNVFNSTGDVSRVALSKQFGLGTQKQFDRTSWRDHTPANPAGTTLLLRPDWRLGNVRPFSEILVSIDLFTEVKSKKGNSRWIAGVARPNDSAVWTQLIVPRGTSFIVESNLMGIRTGLNPTRLQDGTLHFPADYSMRDDDEGLLYVQTSLPAAKKQKGAFKYLKINDQLDGLYTDYIRSTPT
jgi:hypothetical protein